ncbi:MAG: glycosyl transferase [Rhodobacteraceae bacterium]|nr:glycosyl transferase [Paracoccaceae bacterium]
MVPARQDTRQDPVRILLATRNGSRFLQAQLDSYLAQDHGNWALWVSDDGSTDGTWEMLEAFRAAHPQREIVLKRGPGRGSAANFLSLMCDPDLPVGPVALSDQDDVWKPERLSVGLSGLDRAHPTVSAAHTVETDAELRPTRRKPRRLPPPSFHNALVQNILAGNTLTLNGPALVALRHGGRPDVPFHDWWIYLRLSAVGAQVLVHDDRVLFYRQHGGQTLGAHRGLIAGAQRMGALAGGRYRGWVKQNLTALVTRPEGVLPPHRIAAERLLNDPSRLRALRESGARRSDMAGRLILPALALTKRM